MKKYFLSLAVLLTLGATTLFAGTSPGGNPKAVEVFKKQFVNAENVKWSFEGGYDKATFILGGNRAIAVFSSEGELMGSMRDLVYNQLPLVVITGLDNKYPTAVLIDIREVTTAEGTRYKFTLEQKSKKYAVSITPDGSVETVQRLKQ